MKINSYNTNRITGMYSGLDVDKLVKDLTKAEQIKVDKLNKEKQTIQWKQEAYRDIVNMFKVFKDKYFDILSPNRINSTNTFLKSEVKTLLNGIPSDVVTVSRTSNNNSNLQISNITQLATKDTWNGEQTNIQGIKTNGLNIEDIKLNGLEFELSINSNSKVISLGSDELFNVTNVDSLKDILNTKISSVFGSDYDNVVSSTLNNELNFKSAGNTIKLFEVEGNEQEFINIGIYNGISNEDYKIKSIRELFDITNDSLSNISINNKNDFNIKETDTLQEALEKMNNSSAKVDLSYNSLSDKFLLTSTNEGSVNNISLNEEALNFFKKLGIEDNENRKQGQNAKLIVDGVEIVKDSNSFDINGINVNLNKIYDGSNGNIEITSNINSDKTIENIKSFVSDYNNIIDTLNKKLSEKKNYNYEPLTTSQKEEMSEKEIEKWEIKAKEGILNDSRELRNILTNMKTSLYQSVEGTNTTLFNIGITSSSNKEEYGKLKIDEKKLEKALNENYNEVEKLFTQMSEYSYDDVSNKAKRYNQNGITNRIYDILNDNIRVFRDSNGYKGSLIELAGIENDASFNQNNISNELKYYDERINKMTQNLYKKEESYYMQFSRLETMLSKLNSQSAWLNQQFNNY